MFLVRELPPLRLHATVDTPDGNHFRWGPDERNPANVVSGITFSTTMPGGFDQASVSLPRKPTITYQDMQELATVRIRGAGDRIAWEGRMETQPQSSGDQMTITPGLVGWQSHLDDDSSARMIYLDIDLTQWQDPTVNRQSFINSIAADLESGGQTVLPDPNSGQPALSTQMTSTWSRPHYAEAWYDAHGIQLKSLYYAWKRGSADMDPAQANWTWFPYLSTDDNASAFDSPGNLRAAGPGQGIVSATTSNRKWAALQLLFSAALTAFDGFIFPIYWTFLGVVGNHNVPIQGTLTATGGIGVLASDVEAHAVATWAPKIGFTTGQSGSITPSKFVIPQMTFTDPTTTSAIIKAAVQYELRDWAVWEGPTYYSNALGARGHKWQARTRDAQLQETGPQVSRIFNGVIVSYADVTGITRTVGPPGAVVDVTNGSLADPDPTNVATESGIRRWALLQMNGTSTPASAINTGSAFLAQQKLLDTSGQASLVGHVYDDFGIAWPAYMVRAGDQIMFVDAAQPSYRRIVSTSYDDSSKTNVLQLDAPPDGMTALLERLSVVLMPWGLT